MLAWTCGSPGARLRRTTGGPLRPRRDARYWESEAAHYTYWLAIDLFRVAASNREETQPPDGAVYDATDGSGSGWV
jgi:hypothetical protein